MRNLLLLTLSLFTICIQARTIYPDEAASIAATFLNVNNSKQNKAAVQITKSKTIKSKSAPELEAEPYYIFNAPEDNGFVIVSGDDRAKKILGYSDKGSFDFENMPPQLQYLLDQYAKQIQSLPEAAPTDSSWTETSSSFSNETDGILLETANWGQGYPYNAKCPVIDGVQCPTGCVATAMAIVMKYHNWPPKGRGKYEYDLTTGTIKYNFEEDEYNFSNMLNYYIPGNYNTVQVEEISKLMKAAGVSAKMSYGPSESGTYPYLLPKVLHKYFKYSSKCQYINQNHFSIEEQFGLLKNQINSRMPLLIDLGAHLAVCDGYNLNEYIHLNWGWEGVDNGFYQLSGVENGWWIKGMVINITPSDESEQFSEVLVQGPGISESDYQGLLVSKSEIKEGEAFSITINSLVADNYVGDFSIALFNSNHEIKSILRNARTGNEILRNWGIGFGRFIAVTMSGCFNCSIDPTDSIAVVTKDSSNNEWQILRGAIDAPSILSVQGNHPAFCDVDWNFYGNTDIINPTLDLSKYSQNYFASHYTPHLSVYGGVAAIKKDGIWHSSASDFKIFDDAYFLCKPVCKYDVFCYRYDQLLSKELFLNGIPLSNLISDEEMPLISRLKIHGKISEKDYYFIRENFPSLEELDLSDADFGDSKLLPTDIVTSRLINEVSRPFTIKFPQNLTGFDWSSGNFSSLIYLDIPKGVNTYENTCLMAGTGLLMVSVKSKEPANVDVSDWFLGDKTSRENVYLVVPVGSKDIYQSHPSWQGFKEIIENDTESENVLLRKDGSLYLIVHDFAILVGFYYDINAERFGVIHSEIEYNGTRYPVRYTAHYSRSTYQWHTYINHNDELNIIPNSYAGLVYTNRLNWIFDNLSGQIYVPGAFDSPNDKTNIVEMWNYKIDKINNLLSISPTIPEIIIDTVIINGTPIIPTKTGIYHIPSDSPVEVSVTYTLNGEYSMTTYYPESFNESLPHSNIENPVQVSAIEISPTTVLGEIGDEIQLTALVYPEDATDKNVTWSSDNEVIATIDEHGLLRLLNEGSAIIKAISMDGSGVEANCFVTVKGMSGIEEFIALDSHFDIYDATGMILKKNASVADLKTLQPGLYVVAGKKVLIK